MTDEVKLEEAKHIMAVAPTGFKTFLSNHQPFLSTFQILPITQNQRDVLQATVECTLLIAYLSGAMDRTKEITTELEKNQ